MHFSNNYTFSAYIIMRQAEEKCMIEQGNILEDLSVEFFEKNGLLQCSKTGGSGDGGIDGHFSSISLV